MQSNINISRLAAILLSLLMLAYITSTMMYSNKKKIYVKSLNDWTLLQKEIKRVDDQLLMIDPYINESFVKNKIVAHNKQGAYVVQDGWKLTLHFQPSIKQLLNTSDDLFIQAIPIHNHKWICLHKESINKEELPLKTVAVNSTFSKEELTWKCQ